MQNGCVRTKKIALDFVFPGELQPPITEGLRRSHSTLTRTYGPRNLVVPVCLYCLVYLVEPN